MRSTAWFSTADPVVTLVMAITNAMDGLTSKIHKVYTLRCGKVQANAACLQADQKNLACWVMLEASMARFARLVSLSIQPSFGCQRFQSIFNPVTSR